MSATALDADQSLTVTGKLPSTGTPSYAWQWLVSVNGGGYVSATQCVVNSGTGASAGATETCTISASTLTAGTYRFELKVTDSASTAETQASSASTTVTVSTALIAPVSPTASATALDVDQGFTVMATIPSTGTPTYSWQWLVSVNGGAYVLATQCAVNNGTGAIADTTETCSIAASTLTGGDMYALKLQVADSATTPETRLSSPSSVVTVSPGLTAGSPTPGSSVLDNGQSVTLAANPSSGSSGYTYQWYSGSSSNACTSLGSPVTGATPSTYRASPTGSTYYCYAVTDSASSPETRTSSASLVTVNSALSAPASPTVSATALDANQTLAVTGVIPSTGTPAYSWHWLVSVNGGAYTSALECTVSSGSAANGGATETCSIAGGALAAGDAYLFELQVTDSADSQEAATSLASSSVAVSSALTVPDAPTVSTTSMNVGQGLSMTGTIPSTGTPPYSWQWLVSADGGTYAPATGCAVSSGSGAAGGVTETCSIAANTLISGETYTFELQVADNATSPSTQTSSASLSVTVTSSSSSSSSSFWVYLGIGLGVLVVMAILVALVVVRRRRRPGTSAPSVVPAEEAGLVGSTGGGPTAAAPDYVETPEDVGQAPPAAEPTMYAGTAAAAAATPVTPETTSGAESDIADLMAELDKISGEVRKKQPKTNTNDQGGAPANADDNPP